MIQTNDGLTRSHEATKPRRDPEELSAIVVDCGYKLHVEAGPGLLESVFEVVLAKMLSERGLEVKRQIEGDAVFFKFVGDTGNENVCHICFLISGLRIHSSFGSWR